MMATAIRVLFVDDEPGMLDIGKQFLERSGDFTVTTATSAPDAIRLLEQESFDTIVSDYQMPEMDGIEFLVLVRTRFGQIPFILFTGKGREEVVIQALNAGADGYLQKGGESGAQFAELSHKIKQAAARKKAEGALRKSELRYRSLFENMLEGFAYCRMLYENGRPTDFIYLNVNPAFNRVIGTSVVVGKPVTEVFPGIKEAFPELFEIYGRVASTGEPESFDIDFVPSKKWLHISVYSPVKEYFVAIFEDITERKRAELELVSAQESLNDAHRLAHIGTWDWVMENDTVTWSEELYNIAGRDPSLPAPTYAEHPHVYTPASWDILSCAVTRALTTCEPYNLELELVRQDGSIRWVNAFGGVKRDGEGNVIGLHGTVQDITERKRAEEAMRESHDRFEVTLASLDDAVLLVDPATRLISECNDATTRIFGYSHEELVGRETNFLHVDQAHLEQFGREAKATYEDPGYYTREFEMRRKDGRVFPTEHFVRPVHDPDGRILYVVSVVRDITGRKKAEEAQRESEERYRTLVASVDEAIILQEKTGEILTWNRAAERLFGVTAKEVLGHTATSRKWKTIREDGTEYPDSEHPSMHTLATGEACKNIVMGITSAVGRFSWVNINTNPLFREGDAKPYAVVISLLDITDRKRAEEALHKANKQLNLLSDITRHDILNQLLVLRGYLELSHDVIDKPEALKEYIKKEQHAAITIEEQITFTRDYQNLGVSASAWQNVNASIRNTMVALPMRAVHIEPDPAEPEVYADPLFEKVFYNLIDNALRYGGDQMKTIRVSSQESDTSLTIICEDDGVGIMDEDKKKLFRKGFGKHTGLGLFLSREILAITGITITENGTPGKGARFEITVPKGAYRFTATGEK